MRCFNLTAIPWNRVTIEREGWLVPDKTWGAISEPIESIVHHVQHHPASTLALRTPLVPWISKDVVRIRITAALLPPPSPNGTTSGEALHVYSQDDTDGVCMIQHENCIKHEHSATVLTDHVSLWLMEGLSKWRGFYSGCLDRMCAEESSTKQACYQCASESCEVSHY